MQNSRAARTLDTMEGHRAEALDEAFQESLRLTAPCNSPLIAEPQQPASGPPGAAASEEEEPLEEEEPWEIVQMNHVEIESLATAMRGRSSPPASRPPATDQTDSSFTSAFDAMALSTLSGDQQGVILGQLRNRLEPRLVMCFSSASKGLRALLPPPARQQLRADYEEATALCVKVGMRDCRELREATEVEWFD